MDHKLFQKCILRMGDEEGEAWVPKEYSKNNNRIRVKDDDGEWSDVWTIHQPCFAWAMKGDEVELVDEAKPFEMAQNKEQRCEVCGGEIPSDNIKSGGENRVCSARCFDKGKVLLKEVKDED